MEEKRVLEFSWAALWKVLVFFLFVVILFSAKNIVFGLFLAIVIASGLEVPLDILEKRKIPRTLSAMAVFVLIVFAIVVFLYAVVPLVIINLNDAVFNLQKASQGTWWQPLFNIKASKTINDFMTRVVDSFISGGSSPFASVSQVFGGVSLTISVFILSFYLSVRRDAIEKFIRIISPAEYEETILRIFEHSRRRMGLWFRAQFILSLIVTIMVWAALSILGVPYPLLLGVIAGILELIPFVGPIIAGALAVLVALSVSSVLAIYTLVVFLAIQQFESNILVPFLMNRAVGLHPVLVIISILIGLEIGGFIGALIAVPVSAIFQEIGEDWERDRLARSTVKAKG